jgi:D-tyrosyl-tRNA(Tyr) deacylase
MRLVIQRVLKASLTIENKIYSEINQGLLVLIGIGKDDSEDDIEWLCKKLIALRIFSDEEGKMNLSVEDIKGEIMLVSQFTLHASTKKGNRPSYLNAANPSLAIPLYEQFIAVTKKVFNGKVETGVFGADMQISLVNDGPVTIIIDSKNRE